MIQKIFDRTFWKFVLVGVINTLVGTMVMFIAYNLFEFGYWISSAANYIVGSLISYFLNKYFTFKNKKKSLKQVFTFIANILICYLVAYGIAKPLISWILKGYSSWMQDNISMFLGMIFFVLLNYVGQRMFVFKNNEHE